MTDDEGRRPDREYPISIKGVLIRDEAVLLLKNDRDEWELPGDRLTMPHGYRRSITTWFEMLRDPTYG